VRHWTVASLVAISLMASACGDRLHGDTAGAVRQTPRPVAEDGPSDELERVRLRNALRVGDRFDASVTVHDARGETRQESVIEVLASSNGVFRVKEWYTRIAASGEVELQVPPEYLDVPHVETGSFRVAYWCVYELDAAGRVRYLEPSSGTARAFCSGDVVKTAVLARRWPSHSVAVGDQWQSTGRERFDTLFERGYEGDYRVRHRLSAFDRETVRVAAFGEIAFPETISRDPHGRAMFFFRFRARVTAMRESVFEVDAVIQLDIGHRYGDGDEAREVLGERRRVEMTVRRSSGSSSP
jgi:hypothetical protein